PCGQEGVMSIYDDARKIASDLIGEFKQGTVQYIKMVPGTGGRPDAPAPSTSVVTTINAVARPVSTKYVDGSHILQSDKQVTIPNDGKMSPDLSGFIKID